MIHKLKTYFRAWPYLTTGMGGMLFLNFVLALNGGLRLAFAETLGDLVHGAWMFTVVGGMFVAHTSRMEFARLFQNSVYRRVFEVEVTRLLMPVSIIGPFLCMEALLRICGRRALWGSGEIAIALLYLLFQASLFSLSVLGQRTRLIWVLVALVVVLFTVTFFGTQGITAAQLDAFFRAHAIPVGGGFLPALLIVCLGAALMSAVYSAFLPGIYRRGMDDSREYHLEAQFRAAQEKG